MFSLTSHCINGFDKQFKTNMLKLRSKFCYLFHTGNILFDKRNKKALSVKINKVGYDNETFVYIFFMKAFLEQSFCLLLRLTSIC